MNFKRWFKDTAVFAFCQGLYEQLVSGGCAGRTHPISHSWNAAYDRGMNLGDWIRGAA